jgi:hypothetical protein
MEQSPVATAACQGIAYQFVGVLWAPPIRMQKPEYVSARVVDAGVHLCRALLPGLDQSITPWSGERRSRIRAAAVHHDNLHARPPHDSRTDTRKAVTVSASLKTGTMMDAPGESLSVAGLEFADVMVFFETSIQRIPAQNLVCCFIVHGIVTSGIDDVFAI